jgi:hypothetical protein
VVEGDEKMRAILGVLMLTSSALHVASAQTATDIERLVSDIFVQVKCGDALGGGLIVGASLERVYVVTAQHVVRTCAESPVRITFRGRPSEPLDGRVLDEDDEFDLAVLAVPGDRASFARQFDYNVLGNSSRVERGVRVHTMSHPAGRGWTVGRRPGVVNRRDERFVLVESDLVNQGSSGGLLFDEGFGIVGFILQKDGPFAKAVLMRHVLNRLRDWGYGDRIQLRERPGPPAPTQPEVLVETRPRPQPPLDELTFDNTIFQMPPQWNRTDGPDGSLILRTSLYQEHPRIVISPSALLRGNFRAACEQSLRPEGWQSTISNVSSFRAAEGYDVIRAIVMIENPVNRSRLHFIRICVNPDDRFEQITFTYDSPYYQLTTYGPAFDRFLDSVDYVNARSQRAR